MATISRMGLWEMFKLEDAECIVDLFVTDAWIMLNETLRECSVKELKVLLRHSWQESQRKFARDFHCNQGNLAQWLCGKKRSPKICRSVVEYLSSLNDTWAEEEQGDNSYRPILECDELGGFTDWTDVCAQLVLRSRPLCRVILVDGDNDHGAPIDAQISYKIRM